MTEQLAGMDAAFLALESPESPMHVVGVLLLDPSGGAGFSTERLRQVISDRLHLMPPFHRRLVDVPLSLDKPYWHYDIDVDIDEHLHRTTVAPPGDLTALGQLVGEIAERRLARDRPLWELHVATGMSDGRVALIAKVHHSTLYGAAGIEFIGEMLDLTPDPVDKPAAEPAPPAPIPGATTLTGRAVATAVRMPVSTAGLVFRAGRNVGSTLGALRTTLARHGRSALPSLAPRLPISGAPTPRRAAAFTALSLDEVRRVKDAAGVTVNDVVLALVAASLRDYLLARDALPDGPVVVSVPVNAGEGSTVGTNTLAGMLVSLPVGVTDADELLAAVHAATVAAKEFTAAIGTSALGELADITPPAALSAVTWLSRSLALSTLQPPLANLIVSNVMGPPVPLFLAGARVDAIYPLGPLLTGAGMNVTVLSNLDRLDVGILGCPDLVDDVGEVAAGLQPALAALAAR